MDLLRLFDDPSGIGLEVFELGSLHFSSVQIFCCYPFRPNAPIKVGFATGECPVTLWLTKDRDFGTRVALAAVRFNPGTPGSFFEAVCRREEGASSSGFEVDSGLACFMDGSTARELGTRVDAY